MILNRMIALAAILLSGSAVASSSLPSLAKPLPFLESTALDIRYQVGSSWGKIPVSEIDFSEIPTLERISKGTIKLGGGTAFYLGKFAGQHVIATNHHVCPSKWQCKLKKAQFPLLGKSYGVDSFIGTWSDVDAALMTIKVPKRDEGLLESVSNPFNFKKTLYRGQELATVGFGVANNPTRKMVINFDEDCKVFSGEDEFRFMPDPDDLNTGSYKAWSFANGCDISHGDSGSAMVDRASGEVVGIIWTGKIPKSDRVQDSGYLDNLLDLPSEEIWKELSYAVPAQKIASYLQSLVDSNKLTDFHRNIVMDMLD